MADYYTVLRIGHNATRKDINQAYERLMKESKYDTTIDKAAVETAYRVLSDIATKAQYDARRVLKAKRQQGKNKKEAAKFSIQAALEWLTLRRLLYILAVSITVTVIFYSFRFGYKLKEFHAGDVIYDKATKAKYGQIVRVEDHDFGDRTEKAYLIQLEKSQFVLGNNNRIVWFPQDVVKARCYKE